ncbi:MAG: acetamidase/formamidase family protein [Vicinamibacterales bacterium]
MKTFLLCGGAAAVTAALSAALPLAQAPRATVYEGARLIIGDGRPPVENGALLVQNGRIVAAGARSAVAVPAGAAHVNLTGKTVMPAMINAHVHIGYEGYSSWGAANYTPENVLDHLQREAFYGVGATQSVGSSPTDQALKFQQDQRAGKFPPASRFLFMPGMAPPNGGPDAVLRVATTALHVINEVSTPQEARAAVRAMAAKHIASVKIWVDDRRGTYPKLSPDIVKAIIDEAHSHKMRVNAHATTLPDQKEVVRDGADVLVHLVQNEKLDDEFLALLREKKPYWATVIGLGDRTEVCEHDPFFEEALPADLVAQIRATTVPRPLAPYCGPASPNAARREEIVAYNFQKMIASGARIVLGTDTGLHPGHTFGTGDHHELARWVQLGLSPADAIVAATSRPAELLGLSDMGTLAAGKSGDFVVLDANPLDDIHNTRKIASVYLHGQMLDRGALLARWQGRRTATPPAPAAAATHELKLLPQNVHWGYYDPGLKPALRVESGDTVRVETMIARGLQRLRAAGVTEDEIPEALKVVERTITERGPGAHPMTGPIFVDGAEPGDVLEVKLLGFEFLHPYGVSGFIPGSGTLPDEFPYVKFHLVRFDERAGTASFVPGVTLKLAPFFGSIGVAPHPLVGRISSGPPGPHAGNLDNKELVAGSTLYIPVAVPGALISFGDGHAMQGDGEATLTALETSLRGTVQLTVRKGMRLKWPRAETPTHYIAMGLHTDLDEAAKLAVKEMIDFLVSERKMNRDEAYILCSVAVDLHVTQLVDGTKGVHAMLAKAIFTR